MFKGIIGVLLLICLAEITAGSPFRRKDYPRPRARSWSAYLSQVETERQQEAKRNSEYSMGNDAGNPRRASPYNRRAKVRSSSRTPENPTYIGSRVRNSERDTSNTAYSPKRRTADNPWARTKQSSSGRTRRVNENTGFVMQRKEPDYVY